MATTAAAPPFAATSYSEPSGVWSWITTVDHKRIGTLYFYSALTFFMIGGLEAVIMRLQLQNPNGTVVSAQTFNQLFTMHGTTMIFLAIMPLSAAFFNYLIPLQIGARDVAFPRLNAFSYWIFILGGIFLNVSWLIGAAPNGGWFGYTPLTTRQFSSGLNIDFWMFGLQILGISSLAAAFNFLTTIINLRAPGMTLMRMPIFTWMSFVVQFLLVLAFPVITIALVFLMFDRVFDTNFYNITNGADPLLWQHLFWVFGHPEVYILVLPAFGLVSEVLPTFSRKPLFGYPVMVYSGILIGILGFGVWAHHMFVVGMGPIPDTVFALSTMLIAIPTGVKIFNWLATIWGGQIRLTTSMWFALSLIFLFTIGGISGVMHSSPPAVTQQSDTYFIVAHFHYVLFGGSMMGIFAGVYLYFPKMTGRMLNERAGKWHFWLTFLAMNLTFMPMHWAGMLGMPRRVYRYDEGQGFDLFNAMSSYGSYLLAIATAIFVVNLLWSRKKGPVAGNDPWGGATLEWELPSPPPDYNFAVLPHVTSRHPLWDAKAGKHSDEYRANAQAPTKSAKALGIPMPLPTWKPALCAVAIIVFFIGLMMRSHAHGLEKASLPVNMMPSLIVMVLGGLSIAITLVWWLCSPLEEEH